jgi:hypothetical protein
MSSPHRGPVGVQNLLPRRQRRTGACRSDGGSCSCQSRAKPAASQSQASRVFDPCGPGGGSRSRQELSGQRNASRALNSGARAGPPFPFFRFPKWGMERREAPPADRRRLANPKPGFAARHGRSPVTRGCRFRARGPSDVGPGASRRSTAMPLSGTASCSLFERRDRRRPQKEQNRNINTGWKC